MEGVAVAAVVYRDAAVVTAVVTVVAPGTYCTWVTVGRTRTGVGPVVGVVTGNAVVITGVAGVVTGISGVSVAVPVSAVVFSPGCTHPPMRRNRTTTMRSTIATRAILK
jgi:hypothetical protein